MGNKPSRVRQREIQQIVRGAKKAGASGITVHLGDASVVIALNAAPVAAANELDESLSGDNG